MTLDFLRATVTGDRARATTLLGAALPEDWPDDAPVALWANRSQDEAALPWLARAVILRDTGEMIGHAGCHLPPGAPSTEAWAPGGVEIGYTILEAYRRRGYASEAVMGLVDWAASEGVTAVMATTAVGNVASQAVLGRCGFTRVGEIEGDEDGPEYVWVRQAPPDSR